MNTKNLRIFISSTWADLQEEREVVKDAILRMGFTFIGMEVFGSRPTPPSDVCLDEVEESDIFILIMGHRYGAISPGQSVSFVELEYERARERGVPCFVYLKDENTPVLPSFVEQSPDGALRLRDFRNRLKTNHVVAFFSSAHDLSQRIATDLHKYVIQNFLRGQQSIRGTISLADIIPPSMLELVLEGLSQRCQIPIGLFSPNPHGGYYSYPRHLHFSPYCKMLREFPEGRNLCERMDVDFAKKCMESGKPVIYECHAGVTDFAVPMWVGGKCVGALFGGQMVVDDQKTKSLGAVEKVASRFGVQGADLVKAYKGSKVYTQKDLYYLIDEVVKVASYFEKLAREKSFYAAESDFASLLPESSGDMRLSETVSAEKLIVLLSALTEQEFTLRLVVPMLERAGYTNVKYCHGRSEAGCDLLFEHMDPLGSRIRYGAQIKMTKIHSRASSLGNVATLLSQAKAALMTSFCNEFTGETIPIDQFWYISPGDVTQDARQMISSHNQNEPRVEIRFLVGQELIEKLKRHVPVLLDGLVASHKRTQ